MSKDADIFGTLPLGSKEKSKIQYLRQLEAYMAMTDSDKGLILVQLLMHYQDRPFVEFAHTMTKEQRAETLEKLKMDATLLKEAIRTKNPQLARHIVMKWIIIGCVMIVPMLENAKYFVQKKN